MARRRDIAVRSKRSSLRLGWRAAPGPRAPDAFGTGRLKGTYGEPALP
jgi:hypothetical protein